VDVRVAVDERPVAVLVRMGLESGRHRVTVPGPSACAIRASRSYHVGLTRHADDRRSLADGVPDERGYAARSNSGPSRRSNRESVSSICAVASAEVVWLAKSRSA
jgi:hypothetical protein